ncbi:alpha-1,4-glucan--maltose-1-phosphate maltosyltransferase [Arcanobacterium wilhelmae]|uniref:alpha-1,4-glucan--maltose-1-phosphate maltosyltransferase n=1 Tax=Arcanobacterium wilhelmae TaxID=1803177 RepID=UPI002415486D|nr:alpha-1,4-glucan--maltose-1-phosphate maltosyltransferase [Arcanobacterium wilhelmae]WFN89902.1 alpha-1,4-glucan--maltose-1-phosphate maltosyltransferase [Arcanobacterium wilhelmae]
MSRPLSSEVPSDPLAHTPEPATTPGGEPRSKAKHAATPVKGPVSHTSPSAPSGAVPASVLGSSAPAGNPFGVPQPAPFAPVGRIPIVDISPKLADGAWAVKGTEHEAFPVRATIFREGHDLFAAEAVLVDPQGHVAQRVPMVDIAPGLRRHEAWLTPTAPGRWTFYISAWSDPWATWRHNAEIKLAAGQDIELVFLEGQALLARAAKGAPASSGEHETFLAAGAATMNTQATARERYASATNPSVLAALEKYPLRDLESHSASFPVAVDRERALVGSWYEIFPRSIGAYQAPDGSWVSGTLRTAAEGLDRIAGMGFDVVYLTPIHPIGTTARKGKNNTLTAMPGDPGSPYAIGSPDGGHDAIDPVLGTFGDFDAFVGRARELGMEVAMDFALQCSPDHPWVVEHPEWFTTRADGTIAYAENPPKKYQDIYPLNFDNDPEGIYAEIVRILELWVAHGVTIFRVDNPHTKPVAFWQRLLAEFRERHPEVIFLAEAFTQPPMMQTLGAIGFHQSYTYFAWRNERGEIEDYLRELAYESDSRLRPAFWPTTHDILTPYMQNGGRNAFMIRAILAATGSPTWGIYSGYELVEREPRPGFEEQNDNEKYEYKPRDFEAVRRNGVEGLLTRLNEIRSRHVALQRLRNVHINGSTDEKILSFTKIARRSEVADSRAHVAPAQTTTTGAPWPTVVAEDPNEVADAVIVVVNLDAYTARNAELYLDLSLFGARANGDEPVLEVTDELTGETYHWNSHPFVRLDPSNRPAHILSVKVIK